LVLISFDWDGQCLYHGMYVIPLVHCLTVKTFSAITLHGTANSHFTTVSFFLWKILQYFALHWNLFLSSVSVSSSLLVKKEQYVKLCYDLYFSLCSRKHPGQWFTYSPNLFWTFYTIGPRDVVSWILLKSHYCSIKPLEPWTDSELL